MPLLVLDEQLGSRRLIDGLRSRGLDVQGLGDFGLTGQLDPDVLRRVDGRYTGAWVFVTMDFTIIEDHPGFDWTRYAIAWVAVHQELAGAAFEQSKANIVHHHALRIIEQGRGDHHTYTEAQRHKSRPSLASQLRRRL